MGDTLSFFPHSDLASPTFSLSFLLFVFFNLGGSLVTQAGLGFFCVEENDLLLCSKCWEHRCITAYGAVVLGIELIRVSCMADKHCPNLATHPVPGPSLSKSDGRARLSKQVTGQALRAHTSPGTVGVIPAS